MTQRSWISLLATVGSSALLIAACSTTPEAPPPPPPPAPAPVVEPPKPAPAPVAAEEAKPAPVVKAEAPKPKPVAQKVTLATDVLFDFDKAVIRPDGKSKLDDLVTKIKAIQLEVAIGIGHADRIGTAEYNQKLSVRRADAVKAYLISRGVEQNRIYTEGKGETQPVKSCPAQKDSKALIACLAPNRRVEIEVIGTRSN